MSEHIATLVALGRLGEAVQLALERPSQQVTEQLTRAGALHAAPHFLDRWLAALPPLERLQAAASLANPEQLLGCHADAALAFAVELRDFWSFTDGPDAEVAPAIMDRLREYAAQLESWSFDPDVPRRPAPDVPRSVDSLSEDHPPFEALPYVPAGQNDLMALIATGQQVEALRLALDHRSAWVRLRLEYGAVETNDEASSAFLQTWLPALPPLERLQAASWASSNFQLALVQLPHAYGIGARLLLEALAAAAGCWAGLLRDLGAAVAASPDHSVSRRLLSYADELEAMSFEPILLEPED